MDKQNKKLQSPLIGHKTIKGTERAHRMLQQIAAMANEHQYAVLERLLEKELAVQRKKVA